MQAMSDRDSMEDCNCTYLFDAILAPTFRFEVRGVLNLPAVEPLADRIHVVNIKCDARDKDHAIRIALCHAVASKTSEGYHLHYAGIEWDSGPWVRNLTQEEAERAKLSAWNEGRPIDAKGWPE